MSTKPVAAPVAARPEDEMMAPAGLVGYGLQHILSMFGGVIAVPIIVAQAAGLSPQEQAILISCSLFISGVATVLQSVGVPFFGSQLPLVQGISFASVATLTTIIRSAEDGRAGLQTAYGACLVAGIIALIIVPFFAQVIRFFPHVVTGSIITVIGLSLMPVAGRWITGQAVLGGQPNPNFANMKDIGLAMATLAICMIFNRIRKLARMSILLALVVGTLISFATGQNKPFQPGNVLAIPLPLQFGAPIFAGAAIVSMFIVMLVIMWRPRRTSSPSERSSAPTRRRSAWPTVCGQTC